MRDKQLTTMFVDSHCHLDFKNYQEDEKLQSVIREMELNQIVAALCISTSLNSHEGIRKLVEKHDSLWGAVGVHPNNREEDLTVDRLVRQFDSDKFIAVGETGLDYFRSDQGVLDWQREQFRTHIRAARELNRPLVIHCREAEEDVLAILKAEKAHEVCGVMHCFTGTKSFAKAAIEELGFAISFSGILTFKNASELRETAKDIPLDHLLIETDAPYLAPEPYRGKDNQPAWVRKVAEAMAKVKEVSLEDIGRITTNNFNRLFTTTIPVLNA